MCAEWQCAGGCIVRQGQRDCCANAFDHVLLTSFMEPEGACCRAPQVSPLVQRGLILNERTGKAIKIGGATYNRLVLQACLLPFRF